MGSNDGALPAIDMVVRKKEMSEHAMTLPFEGITVVELGTSVAAPFAGKILAELGARVIKVENPDGGDPARRWYPAMPDGNSASFQSVNMGKLSVAVDMTDAEDMARLKTLIVDQADVVLQNLRPGAVQRFSIDAETLRKDKPGLIYCNAGAFGDGPLGSLPGYDPLMQAFSGITDLTGEADRPPSRVGVSLIDLGTGMWSAIGIISALYRRLATGEGGVVDTSLFETSVGWITLPVAELAVSGKAPTRSGLQGPIVAPNRGYQATDGIQVIVVGTDGQFRRFCDALDCPELADDPRFTKSTDRLANEAELSRLVGEIIATDTRAAWSERLNAAGIPNAPVQTVEEVVAHPQTAALGLLRPGEDLNQHYVGLPMRLDGERPASISHAPRLDEHRQQVFDFMKTPA
jgi:crotonobetainyl-CoA:carnitine CoA-transferase CaiB-like acyl-CoA transferase